MESRVGEGGRLAVGLSVELLRWIAWLVTTSTISGLTAIIVAQLAVAPLRPVEVGPAFEMLRRRWWPALRTAIVATVRVLLGFALLLVPGLVLAARYSVWAPVVLMEGIDGVPALRRSRALVSRAWGAVAWAMLFQFVLPVVAEALVQKSTGLKADASHGGSSGIPAQALSLSGIVVLPLMSIVPALLYLKTRRLGGETLDDVVAQLRTQAGLGEWERKLRSKPTTLR